MMDRQHAIDIIRASPLAEVEDVLIENMLPSARLVVDAEDAVGGGERSSHFGGLPSLPRSVEWPRWDQDAYLRAEIARYEEQLTNDPRRAMYVGDMIELQRQLSQGPQPLAFLCQLFLSEMHAAAPLDAWPCDGSLAFFYDPEQNWGSDPEARGHCRVIYVPESEELIPVQAPVGLPDEVKFPHRRLRFRREWSLPTSLTFDAGHLSIWGSEDYSSLLLRLMSASNWGEPIHRCGGHPQRIQGDMRLECQLVTNGLYCGDSTSPNDPRRAALKSGAADWQLLLQLDSDEKRLGWMWGDVGRVYYWIRRQDLAATEFESAWAILQCS